jgi:hypothetical protein
LGIRRYPHSKTESFADLLKANAANAIDEEVSNDSLAGPDPAKWAKREISKGFLTGTSIPGRRSTPVRSIILLRCVVY